MDEELLHEDVEHMLLTFNETCEEARNNLKPNILITGIVGAGKSTIVKQTFGKAFNLDRVLLNKYFEKYEDHRLVIYDGKGLEIDYSSEFLEEIQNFFHEHQMTVSGDTQTELKSKIQDALHVVWYIIDSTAESVHSFELFLCKDVFKAVPVIFILSKADQTTEEHREELKESIRAANLPNMVDIFDVSANPVSLKQCPNCNSTNIRKAKEKVICSECGPIAVGLDGVVAKTLDLLPEVTREAFISTQKVSFCRKDLQAMQIIREFHEEFDSSRSKKSVLKKVANMLSRLSSLWNFTEHAQLYGKGLAKDLSHKFTFRDKVFLLIHNQKKEENRKCYTTAVGVLWNRCVREVNKRLLREFEEFSFSSSNDLTKSVGDLKDDKERDVPERIPSPPPLISADEAMDSLDEVFVSFSTESIQNLSLKIKEEGLEPLLQSELHLQLSTTNLKHPQSYMKKLRSCSTISLFPPSGAESLVH